MRAGLLVLGLLFVACKQPADLGPGSCATEIEQQYKVTGIATVTEGYDAPVHWKQFRYEQEGYTVRYEWRDDAPGCKKTITNP